MAVADASFDRTRLPMADPAFKGDGEPDAGGLGP